MSPKKWSNKIAWILLLSLLVIGSQSITINAKETNNPIKIAQFKAPKVGAPAQTSGGGTRGVNKDKLLALIPESQVGLTTSKTPSFFVYVPATKDKIKFTLTDQAQEKTFYEAELQPPSTSGIVSVNTDQMTKKIEDKLEVGKFYRWTFEIIHDASDASANSKVMGWVQLVEPSKSLTGKLAKIKPNDKDLLMKRSRIYAEEGIWHEAIQDLITLRQQKPNDFKVNSAWKDLMRAVKLPKNVKSSDLAQANVVECCKPTQN